MKVVVGGFVTRTPNYPFIGGPVSFGPAENSVIAWGDGVTNHSIILNGSGNATAETITDYVFFFGQGLVHSVSRAGYQTRSVPGVVGDPPVYCGERIWHPPCDTFSGVTNFTLTPLVSQLSLQADSTQVKPGSTVAFRHAANPLVVDGRNMPIVVDSTHWIPDDTAHGGAVVHRAGMGACQQLNPCRRTITASGTFSMSAWVNGTRYEKDVHIDAQTDELVVELTSATSEVKPVLDRQFDAVAQTWFDAAMAPRLHDLVDLQVTARWMPSGRPADAATVQWSVESVNGSGFHPHLDPPRPKGSFFGQGQRPTASDQKKGVVAPELVLTTDSDGKATATYRTSGVSGIERIQIRLSAEGQTVSKSATVTIRWPGLVPMARSAAHWEFSDQSHTKHGNINNYGDAAFVSDVTRLFDAYFAETEAPRFDGVSRFVVNEVSLEWGGLFDDDGSWRPPHNRHRTGEDMDVRYWTLTREQREQFQEICGRKQLNLLCDIHPGNEPSPRNRHYHLMRP